MDLFVPKSYVEAGTKVTKVNAKLNMNQYGACPQCGKAMIESIANGHEVLLCVEHRIVLPKKDEE
jgi:hypothetical protein